MKVAAYVDVSYTQTEGMTTAIINNQFHFPVGLDILGKREYFKAHYDWIRTGIMREPRGHNNQFGGVIVPSSTPEADIGVIWIDCAGYGDMCGHGTIATSTLMASNNLLPRQDGESRLRLETPAGIVTSEVFVEGDQIMGCRFQNVPGYLAERDIVVTVPELGDIKVDIAFGGNYFITVRLDPAIKQVAPENAAWLGHMGNVIKNQINERFSLVHPEKPHITEIDLVTFYHEVPGDNADYRWVHAYRNGSLDRSPGGTGTSAMLAMLEGRGEIRMNQKVRAQGLLGLGTFEGELIGETMIGNHRGVISTVKGRSKLIGFGKWFMDPTDPVGRGYNVDQL